MYAMHCTTFCSSGQVSSSGSDGISFLGKGCSFFLSDKDLELINKLLQSQNLSSIHKFEAREYHRVIINRKTYTTRYYMSMKKRNNFTVKFMLNTPNYCIQYGIIEKVFTLDDYELALIMKLKIIRKGVLTCRDEDITPKAAELLFSDYLYFEESEECVVFVHQITDICCNLSLNDCNLLSWFPNNIEHE